MARRSAPAGPAAAPGPARAYGRSLGDFPDLSPAEKKLLAGCRLGERVIIGEKRPEQESDANRLRAAFVRFLALGGDAETPVHEYGVMLRGAWLTGVLDIEAATAAHRIGLWQCRIERIEARQSTLKFLNLSGCRVEGDLMGEGLRCEGDLFLRDGFHATGHVRLTGATVGGELDCSAGRFENLRSEALSCDGITVSGGMLLGSGFHATGAVRLVGATIGGDLQCGEGRFENDGGAALAFDRATISGSAFLNGVRASGEVRLLGAMIEGSLDCSKSHFENRRGHALLCDSARVVGRLLFRSVRGINGSIDLSLMHAGSLCDDDASWKAASKRLVLDGFTYGRIAGIAPTNAATRIAWLDLQVPWHLGEEFRPQPWEQLITVLRAMGHPGEARAVAVEKQRRLRKAGRLPRGARPFHWLYGALVGYGYRPLRLVGVTAAVWLLCAAAYWWAANPDPPDPHLIAPPSRQANAAAPDYANFVPLIYSADVLLPVVDLGYKDEWQPVVRTPPPDSRPLFWGRMLRFLYWFEIAFGWVAGLLLVGVLGNLIKKD